MRLPPPLPFLRAFLPAVGSAVFCIGCGGTPSSVNIQLRKDIQHCDAQIDTLKMQHQADLASMRAYRAPTTAMLSPDELDRLYTVHGLSLGRLTGGSNLDSGKPGDQGLKIYVVPTDGEGQPLKAAGTFTVQAFDLSLPENNLIGRWHFDLARSRQSWYGAAFLYTYVLTCPWNEGGQGRVPAHPQLTVRVTFHDELTDREFTDQRIVDINPPPTPLATSVP
jgi:hypothetical protein